MFSLTFAVMKKGILFVALTLEAFSLAAQSSTPDLQPAGPLWGVVYQQRSGEYDALCHQAYNLARWRLDALLAQQTPDAKPPAIVTDIDETLLDNSPYAVHQGLLGKTYSDSTWIAWTARAACDTVPGALDFLTYAASRGVTIIYITNRLQVEQDATLANLQRWGFPQADTHHLVLRQPHAPSSKESRRQIVRADYNVLLYLGDNLTDFSPLFDQQPTPVRKDRVRENAALFGSSFIVLPNAVYGDWAPGAAASKTMADSLKTY